MDEKLKEDLIAHHQGAIDLEGVELVHEGDWVVEYKYEFLETVYKYQDKYYEVRDSRSGSYYSDYFYDDPDVYEVVPKEVTIITWVPVK